MTRSTLHFDLPHRVRRILHGFMGFGLLVFLTGLFAAPERIWSGYLIAEYYLTGLGMAAMFFIAIQYVAHAGWSAAMRRIPEAMSMALPMAGAGMLVLLFGIHTLYEWSHEAAVLEDPVLQGKQAWLNPPFFIVRLILYFVVWITLSRLIVGNSLRQDAHPDLFFTTKNVRYSAIFILVGVYTFCLASIDLLMSLQPHWYSTVFGFFNLAGMFQSGLAMIALLIVLMRRAGYAHLFTTDHLHTIGNLLLAFCIFWVYLWVSQHLLIWYANIPEETSYYVFRHFGGWGTLSFLNVVVNWLVPFFILMPRASKRHDQTMLQVAILILAGRWLDLYLMVMPPALGAVPAVNVWEVGPTLGMLALFFFVVFNTLGKHALIPVNDPYLVESLPAEHASAAQ
jgi:hypothetical protein